jgi:plastocyanin
MPDGTTMPSMNTSSSTASPASTPQPSASAGGLAASTQQSAGAAHSSHRHRPRDAARAAASVTVLVIDFKFTPRTTTAHVGDAVTGTNNSQMPHSATADGGSFDTGLIIPGSSASHTFTQPGRFTYHCSIHPFMHGTVVVLGAPAPARARAVRHRGREPWQQPRRQPRPSRTAAAAALALAVLRRCRRQGSTSALEHWWEAVYLVAAWCSAGAPGGRRRRRRFPPRQLSLSALVRVGHNCQSRRRQSASATIEPTRSPSVRSRAMATAPHTNATTTTPAAMRGYRSNGAG